MNIFLVGFMGSGKSTIGKKIAGRMGYDFVDMDKEIERAQGKSIAAIFSGQGEAHFRNLETTWLKEFSAENTVIATGGGAPCTGNNLEIMKAKGVTVYLQSSPENLAKRLLNSKGERPMIDHLKSDLPALNTFVQSKLAERTPYYLQSDITVDALNFDAAKLDDLVARLTKQG